MFHTQLKLQGLSTVMSHLIDRMPFHQSGIIRDTGKSQLPTCRVLDLQRSSDVIHIKIALFDHLNCNCFITCHHLKYAPTRINRSGPSIFTNKTIINTKGTVHFNQKILLRMLNVATMLYMYNAFYIDADGEHFQQIYLDFIIKNSYTLLIMQQFQ